MSDFLFVKGKRLYQQRMEMRVAKAAIRELHSRQGVQFTFGQLRELLVLLTYEDYSDKVKSWYGGMS